MEDDTQVAAGSVKFLDENNICFPNVVKHDLELLITLLVRYSFLMF